MAVTKAQAGAHVDGTGAFFVNDIQVIGEQQANVADLVITWSANEPTAGVSQTIADGTVPTVAELGQAVKNLNARISALITMVEAHGLSA